MEKVKQVKRPSWPARVGRTIRAIPKNQRKEPPRANAAADYTRAYYTGLATRVI